LDPGGAGFDCLVMSHSYAAPAAMR
jgi:hypothetical protein